MTARIINILVALSVCAAFLATMVGCATVEEQRFDEMLREPYVYTLTNLHTNYRSRVIYAMNYQTSGLIPVCSKVRLVDRAYSYLVFEVLETKIVYSYEDHGHSGEPFFNNISKYFGRECDKEKIDQLNDIDKKGISNGRPYVGMSRQGIVYAMGYPPLAKNANLNANRLYYWKNRFNRIVLFFDNQDTVAQIKD